VLSKNFILAFLLLIIGIKMNGQRTESVLNFDFNTNHLYFEIENDVFLFSDHYYTGGLAIFYTNRKLKNTPAQFILRSKNLKVNYFSGFGIEQRLFTPFSISDPAEAKQDRPYSAYIMITNFSVLVNTKNKLKISNEIGLGILGPGAKGMEFQTFIHELTNSVAPVGWENQINNTPILDYQFRIEKGLFKSNVSDFIIPFSEVRIGTYKDEISLGLLLRLGNSNKMLVYKNAFVDIHKRLVWDFVMEAKFKTVFYDCTLHNGFSGEDNVYNLNYQDIDRFLYYFRTGLNLYYKGFYLRYMVYLNSPDFLNGRYHRYSGIYFGFSF
jgi:lipid A 3-O-deacylase